MSPAYDKPSEDTEPLDNNKPSEDADHNGRNTADISEVLRKFLTEEQGLPPEKQHFTNWMRDILEGNDPIANARHAKPEKKTLLSDIATGENGDPNARVSEEKNMRAEEERIARTQRSIQDEQHRLALQIMQIAFEGFVPVPHGKGEAITLIGDTWNKMTPDQRYNLMVGSNPYSSFMFPDSVDINKEWDDGSNLLGEYILTQILGSHDRPFLPPEEDNPAVERIDTAVKTENKIPPDVMQRWRQNGPEIVLEENESIYHPETVQKIRELLKGKRVLMLDQDGVIIPTELMHGSEIKPNDDVVEAIKKLHEQGYTLMYWTSAKNDTGDVYDMLLKANLASLFTIVICGNNTRLKTSEDIGYAVRMIDSSEWLDDTTRSKLTACIRNGGKENFGPPLVPKLPHCLVNDCATVDDDPWWEEYFPDRETDTAYATAYPAFVPQTHLDSRNPLYAFRVDKSTRDYFGTNWIQRINEAYPPPKSTENESWEK